MMERIGAEAMANSMLELRDGKELFILNPYWEIHLMMQRKGKKILVDLAGEEPQISIVDKKNLKKVTSLLNRERTKPKK